MSFDSETIRTYAVQAVTDFVSNGTPLSAGIAKIASDQNLNPDQIKRVVEASNTVAHLKLLSGSQDRTFEFPVAKYETVLGHMVQPDSMTSQQTSEVAGSAYGTGENIKYAEYVPEQSELETYVAKGLLSIKSDLEKIACEKQVLLLNMEDSIKRLLKTEHPLEKLAEVATEEEYVLISPYFGLEKTASADLDTKLVFTDKELTEARNLVGFIKQAKTLIKEEHEKRAFAAAAGRALGSAIGSVASRIGKSIGSVVGTVGAKAADSINSALNVTGKSHLTSAQAASWDRMKSGGNTALNLGLSTLTTHKNGSVWDQLQK